MITNHPPVIFRVLGRNLHLLPGGAQISICAHQCRLALEELGKSFGISLIMKDEEEDNDTAIAVYYNPKDSVYRPLGEIDNNLKQCLDGLKKEHLGEGFDILGKIMSGSNSASNVDQEWCKPHDKKGLLKFASLRNQRRSSHRNKGRLKERFKNVPKSADTGFQEVKKEISKNFKANAEVVEITDISNPAKLFALPGTPALGLRARQKIAKFTPVLAYGGMIQQLCDEVTSRAGYVFDVEMPPEYEGPRIIIDGEKSIGGVVNDPWTPWGFPKRKANLESIEHWDASTNTPQIVLYATRDIEAGEELLYHYGEEYWKVTWKALIREHAKFSAETALVCRSYWKQILKMSSLTDQELVDKVVETIENMGSNEI